MRAEGHPEKSEVAEIGLDGSAREEHIHACVCIDLSVCLMHRCMCLKYPHMFLCPITRLGADKLVH